MLEYPKEEAEPSSPPESSMGSSHSARVGDAAGERQKMGWILPSPKSRDSSRPAWPGWEDDSSTAHMAMPWGWGLPVKVREGSSHPSEPPAPSSNER